MGNLTYCKYISDFMDKCFVCSRKMEETMHIACVYVGTGSANKPKSYEFVL